MVRSGLSRPWASRMTDLVHCCTSEGPESLVVYIAAGRKDTLQEAVS